MSTAEAHEVDYALLGFDPQNQASLDAFLGRDIELPSPGEEARQKLSIDDRARAEAVARKRAQMVRELEEARACAATNIEAIKGWLEAQEERLSKSISWLEDGLEGYMRGQYRESRVKTVRLPHAHLQLRKATGHIVILPDQEEDLKGFLAENLPEAVKVEMTVRKKELRKLAVETKVTDATPYHDRINLATPDGEPIPGAYIERAKSEVFTVGDPRD